MGSDLASRCLNRMIKDHIKDNTTKCEVGDSFLFSTLCVCQLNMQSMKLRNLKGTKLKTQAY